MYCPRRASVLAVAFMAATSLLYSRAHVVSLGDSPRMLSKLGARHHYGLIPMSASQSSANTMRAVMQTSAVSNERTKDRVRYYVQGSGGDVGDASAPARAAAALGVATAGPVLGSGAANLDTLHANGRLVVLNASICAAGPATLAYVVERQIGPDSPVAREGALPDYLADACAVASPTSAAFVVGDVASCYSRPVFAKARPCGCNTSVLINLTRERHFGFDAVR